MGDLLESIKDLVINLVGETIFQRYPVLFWTLFWAALIGLIVLTARYS